MSLWCRYEASETWNFSSISISANMYMHDDKLQVSILLMEQVHFRQAQQTAECQMWTLAAVVTRRMTIPKVDSSPLQVIHVHSIYSRFSTE